MTGGTKAVTDFSPYITLAAAFCKSVLISVYFCTTRKSISNLPPISLVLAGLPTPKRLMLILDEKWEVQKSIYKSTYLFLGISVAIVSRKGITLFGYMYHP